MKKAPSVSFFALNLLVLKIKEKKYESLILPAQPKKKKKKTTFGIIIIITK